MRDTPSPGPQRRRAGRDRHFSNLVTLTSENSPDAITPVACFVTTPVGRGYQRAADP
jgi:hypothetical protein